MKKNLFLGLITVATAIVVFVNVNEISNEKKLTSLIEIEALATNEWNDWNQWFSQGFTKDEREWIRPCPSEESNSGYGNGSYGGVSIGGGGSHSQTNPSGRCEITCPYGNENGTSVGC